MTTNNHTDRLDRRLERAHRVFQEDHDALRQDLLDRLDDAPGDLPVGAIPTHTSNTRKWMMRSGLGLAAAAITVAAIVGIGLFGSGPTSPSIAWAEVRQNVENATAMHFKTSYLFLDADGNVVRQIAEAEVWETSDGRVRYIRYNSEGEPASESSSTPGDSLTLDYANQHASWRLSETPDALPEGPHGNRVEQIGRNLERMMIAVTDEYPNPQGRDDINGRSSSRFTIAIMDVIRFRLREQHVEQASPEQIKAVFGWTMDEIANLPPVEVWIDDATGLPAREREPLLSSMSESLPESLRGEILEGGRVMIQRDFIDWNEQVDESAFDIHIPDGWAVHRTHSVWPGDLSDAMPDDPNRHVNVGAPLAEGITFRLFDETGELVGTEDDVLGVTSYSHNSHRRQGAVEPDREDRQIVLRYSDTLQKRLDAAAFQPNADQVRWRYELGDEISGQTKLLQMSFAFGANEPTYYGQLQFVDVGELTYDQFRERYLADQ